MMSVQQKIDFYLEMCKSSRGRKRGDFFKSIRKRLIDSDSVVVELSHLKQILFLDKDFYFCVRDKDQDHCLDILIDLPAGYNLTLRRDSFKKKLYEYVSAHQDQNNLMERVEIPQMAFPFEQKIEVQQKLSALNRFEKEEGHRREVLAEKMSNDGVFRRDGAFERELIGMIREKEARLLEEAQRVKGEAKKYERLELLRVFDELHLIYCGKKVNNIHEVVLVGLVSKKHLLQEKAVLEILQVLHQLCPNFLRKVKHPSGDILQIEKRLYKESRDLLEKHNDLLEKSDEQP